MLQNRTETHVINSFNKIAGLGQHIYGTPLGNIYRSLCNLNTFLAV